MRILVLSDSHGDYLSMKKAIESQPTAEAVVFLGDGYENFERCKPLIKDKRVYAVKGNNDFYCDYPRNLVITENGVNIYITHGHYEYVKSTIGNLIKCCETNNCTIALYGHTHRTQSDYIDGKYIFCPGTLKRGEYGVVDIMNNGIICIGCTVTY